MPDENAIIISFPVQTTVNLPGGTSCGVPSNPPFSLSEGAQVVVPAGGEFVFPANSPIIVTPPGSRQFS
jgi:hypothetical protein